MGPNQEDVCLQEAIKTTLLQLCKVGVIYHSELTVMGTVGVTVDRNRTVLVHFDERVGPISPDTSTNVGMKFQPQETNWVNINQQGVPINQQGNLYRQYVTPQNSGTALYQGQTVNISYGDLGVLNAVASSTKNEAYSQTLQTSIPIPIDIDSDSESMCDLQFDDDVIEVDPPEMVRKKEVMWSGEEEYDPKNETKINVEVKNTNTSPENVDSSSGGDGRLASRLVASLSTLPSSVSSLTNEESIDNSSQNTSFCDQNNEATPPKVAITPAAPVKLVVDKSLFLQKAAGRKLPEDKTSPAPSSPKQRITRSKAKRKLSNSDVTSSTNAVILDSIMEYERASHLARTKKKTKNPSPNHSTVKESTKQKCCEVCERDFPTQGLLEAHLVEAHGVVQSVEIGNIVHHQCKHCHKKFRYRATLDKHEFLHVAEKPHRCEICNNSYCYAESLQIHMNIHAGILDCLICQKMYSSRKHLQKHIVYMHEMRRVRSGTTPKKQQINMNPENDEDE